MKDVRTAEDVSGLPTWGFGSSMTTWWSTLAFCLLEGVAFVLAAGVYLYLYAINSDWPMAAAPPDVWVSSALTLLLVLSAWPNVRVKKAALNCDKKAVQIWLVVMCLVGVVLLAIRAWEFVHLNVRWDSNAYGSVVWLILGLHTTHLATDLADTIVLTALFFTRHGHSRRYSDVEDNAVYWNFVILSWLPLYALVYWTPRW